MICSTLCLFFMGSTGVIPQNSHSNLSSFTGLDQGQSISLATYQRWKSEYGGMKTDALKRLKELEKENSRLKRIVADLTIDKIILKEVAEGKW